MRKKLIVMSMSWKKGQYCVAGIDNNNNWIRLVTNNIDTDGAIPRNYTYYVYGKQIGILDLIEVEIHNCCNDKVQPENYLVDLSIKPRFIKSFALEDLIKFHKPEIRECIFGNIGRSIDSNAVKKLGYSLTFIYVNNLRLYKNNKNKSRADFFYNGRYYNEISVTDQAIFDIDREIIHKNAYLVMSVAHKSFIKDGFDYGHYKFVAKIFTK